MAKGKNDVLSLALALIKKSDDQKAQDKVKKEVRDNKHNWGNDLFQMTKAAEAAEESYEALLSNTNATTTQLLDAKRNMDLAKKNLADVEALFEERFGA